MGSPIPNPKSLSISVNYRSNLWFDSSTTVWSFAYFIADFYIVLALDFISRTIGMLMMKVRMMITVTVGVSITYFEATYAYYVSYKDYYCLRCCYFTLTSSLGGFLYSYAYFDYESLISFYKCSITLILAFSFMSYLISFNNYFKLGYFYSFFAGDTGINSLFLSFTLYIGCFNSFFSYF
jgi:hypothetical protein